MRWVLAFTVIPLVELLLLVQLARWIDFWPTVAITIVTGIVGGTLAKREGLRVWRQWQAALRELRPPEQGVLDGLLVLVGGVLLITPGVLTDLTGAALLFRPTRAVARALILAKVDRYIVRRTVVGGVAGPFDARREPIDTQGSPVDTQGNPVQTQDAIDTDGSPVDRNR